MNLPDSLYYTKEHEWVRLDEGGTTATIGITDFAQGELGDIVYVELEPIGTDLAQDDIFGTVEAVKTVSDLYMPLTGTIVALNDTLETHPELVNEDPYEQGWMIKITVSDPGASEGLLSAADYAEMIG